MPVQKKDNRLKFSVCTVLLALVLFTASRATLLFLNPAFFATLTGAQLASAFLNGLRFDFAIIALFMGPAVLLLNLPVKKTWWATLWKSVLVLEAVSFAVMLAADQIYFPKINRHIAEEVLQISNDWGFVFSYAFTQAWPVLLALCAVCALAGWLIWRGSKIYSPRRWSAKKETLCAVLIVLVVVLGIRGHLGRGKSLGVADVYQFASTPAQAALTLNGVFTAYQVGRKGKVESANEFPADAALKNVQKLFVAADETVPDAAYPLMRRRNGAPSEPKHNVLIVLLEGWHPHYVDGLSGNGYGVTPVFDGLLKEGVNFTNAYASGLRSIFGFAAVMASLPLVPGLPAFGYGLELSALSPMPKHFADAGYYTFFAQSSHRDSYRLCALASALGAQESYGWEDIPERLEYNKTAPFGYDYDVFMFAADKIKARKEPHFMGMVFTGITHEPFTSTLSQFDKYPYDSWEHGFLNTLGFADWSIGELLKRAKEDGWFDDTIFVFVADHTSGGPQNPSLRNHFRIPLLVYAPKLFKPQERKYVVSQLDIVPTLYRLTGISPLYTAYGRDLFDTSVPHAALVSEGVNIGVITDEGEMRHSGTQVLDQQADVPAFNENGKAEETVLSLDKAAYTLLGKNKWYREDASK